MPSISDKSKPTATVVTYGELLAKMYDIERRVVDLEMRQGTPMASRVLAVTSVVNSDEPESQMDSTVARVPSCMDGSVIGDGVALNAAGIANGAIASGVAEVTHLTAALSFQTVQGRMEGLRYELKHTIWDVVILVGMGFLYTSDSLMVIFLTVTNLSIQFVFVALVQSSLPTGQIDFTDQTIVKKLTDWRVKIAHDPKYADTFTNIPLAKAICTDDPLNMAGTGQAEIYKDVDDYLHETLGCHSGAILCILAILLWLLTCLREARTCSKLLQGLWCTCYDSGSSALRGFHRLNSARSEAVVQSQATVDLERGLLKGDVVLRISFQRACAVTCCAIVPRIGVLVPLAYVGVCCLIATVNVEDLILNAVALEVIIRVNEMTYDLFCPAPCKRVLSIARPLRLPVESIVFGRAAPYWKVLGFTTLVVLIRFILLGPLIINLVDTQEAMCGGNVDFLAAELAIGPVLAGKPDEKAIDRTSYKYRAILQRTGLSIDESKHLGLDLWYLNSDRYPTLFPFQDVGTAQGYAALTIAAFGSASLTSSYHVVQCTSDMDWANEYPSARHAISRTLAETTGVANHTCQLLKDQGLCNNNTYAGAAQRFFCPATCGIHNATSGLAYVEPIHGVPATCNHELQSDLETLSCQDLPTSHPAFQVYADSLQQALSPGMWRNSPANLSQAQANSQATFGVIRIQGCAYVSKPIGTAYSAAFAATVCNPILLQSHAGIGLRSLRYLCPVSCGCTTTIKTKYIKDGKPWDHTIGVEENCARECFN